MDAKKEIIKQNIEITRIDMQLTNLNKNHLQASVDIYINNLIKISDIIVFETNGKKNISMPYKYDGLFYTFFVSFLDKDIYKIICDEIIKKFDEECVKYSKNKSKRNTTRD